MAEKMTLLYCKKCYRYWRTGCFLLLAFIFILTCVYRQPLENYCLGIKPVVSHEEFSVLAKKNKHLDFEFIAGCYFASPGKELCWDLRYGLDLCFFYDENFVYVIPVSIGTTGFEAKKYGAMIDRETGMVYNRVSRKWEAFGYTAKTLEDVKKNLAGKDLREILAEMGRPIEIEFLRTGGLRLDYETNGGEFWIYLEKGVFLKVEFMDIVRL